MSGFKFEEQIIDLLNTSKEFCYLPASLRKALVKINNGVRPTNIFAKKLGGRLKPDQLYKIDSQNYNISVKKGGGNSVHQEKLETFIPYAKKALGASEETINAIKLIIWSDGTFDGSGKIGDRRCLRDMSRSYPDYFNYAQNFFDRNKKKLIKRFLVTGIHDGLPGVSHLLYGDRVNIHEASLSVAKINSVELFLASQKNNRATLSVGKLSFQAWNIIKDGNPKNNWKRGQIQLKWGSLSNDILNI